MLTASRRAFRLFCAIQIVALILLDGGSDLQDDVEAVFPEAEIVIRAVEKKEDPPKTPD